ncbi:MULTISPECIES: DcrB-related protein [unclassified Blastococcus]
MTEPTWTTSRLRAPVPDGWSVRESWTLLAPDGQANVVVSREPLPPGVGAEQYCQGQGERLGSEFPQYQQHVLTVLPLASGPAYARLFSWAPPAGGRVVQVQLYATGEGAGFTATATTPAPSFDAVAEVLDRVLRSLQFDPGTAPAAQPAPAPPAPAAEEPPAPPVEAPPAPPAGSTSATVLAQLPPRPPAPRPGTGREA